MKKGVLLDQITLGQDIDLAALSQMFEQWQSYETTSADLLIQRCQDAQVVITNKVCLSREHLIALPQLKVIGVAATGTNNIDMACAAELGIDVVNVKGYGNGAVAQHTITLLLQLIGKTNQYQRYIEQGQWSQSPFFSCLDFTTYELAGKTLGIIGYGGLGQSVEKIARAFDMEILIADRPNATTIRDGRVAFETVLKQADVISLHCPLTDNNHHLIDEGALALMKSSALLINTARGPLIDESALLKVLENNGIGGAALDVLSQEPPPANHPLLAYRGDNLIITPHIAWAAREARQRLVNMLAANLSKHV
ncbi:D-2-hydroxyacid dehydrogenase [Psychrobium sp. MM17-31]|uniref:D-2-hydroxyacid dehydrogenase n=1 Tax=Psychrobium sp. MM17-31 TaxID=2917758 RepID=UPI001EF63995|nr:D-2-hydroxyacid dehydrogenase [Psychrobium sp. MM17-31]MCG7533267.1 D-2-hydroxyacid dehydrogenase [Psychrobium sp. MM17-31]